MHQFHSDEGSLAIFIAVELAHYLPISHREERKENNLLLEDNSFQVVKFFSLHLDLYAYKLSSLQDFWNGFKISISQSVSAS